MKTKILRNVLLFFLLFFFLLNILIIGKDIISHFIYLNRLADSLLITRPRDDTQKTAEYLYNNPSPLPSEIASLTGDINLNQLCASGEFAKTDFIYVGISWIVNGTRIPDWMYHVGFWDSGPDDIVYYSCLNDEFYRWLPSGFHLIEIHWQSNPFDSGKSYQFGVRINDVLATPIPTLIPQTP